MHTSPPSSLLVAALLMLHHPCTRNKTTASFLLVRAAEHADLTPAEREACRNIADDLDNECAESLAVQSRPPVPFPVTDWGCERYRRQNPAPGSPLASIEKGVFA